MKRRTDPNPVRKGSKNTPAGGATGAGEQSSGYRPHLSVGSRLKAPFPWFGGKSRVADLVWERFGDVQNYCEPFFGSGAVLLARPHPPRIETVNDCDCYLANFWRALKNDPDQVARYADWPVNEADLRARHLWLIRQIKFRERMFADPDYYDCKIAGWWVWGLSMWIGSGWCETAYKRRPELGSGQGKGVHRLEFQVADKRPHLSNWGTGVNRPALQPKTSHGRTRPHLTGTGMGITGLGASNLQNYFIALSNRLRNVRVCCGDWARICGPSPTVKQGLTGVFLDPPYGIKEAGRDGSLYAQDSESLAANVCKWALEQGSNPLMRIALCGYTGEHRMPKDWEMVRWDAPGGYGTQVAEGRGRSNRKREVIWFSPHCIKRRLVTLYA